MYSCASVTGPYRFAVPYSRLPQLPSVELGYDDSWSDCIHILYF